MIRFTLTAKGLLQLAIKPDRDQLVSEIERDVWVQTLREYVTGTMPGPASANVLDRFKPSAFTRFGFTARSQGYQRRQLRILGQLRPFFSPRSLNWLKVAQALTKPSASGIQGALRSMARQAKPHMRDQITIPGVGHNISVSGSKQIKVTLTYRAARPLNARPYFAAEFRDLARGGTFGRMRQRANTLRRERMAELLQSCTGTRAA